MKNEFYKNVRFDKSLKHALSGIRLIFKNERNFRIILTFAFIIIVFGFLFNISHSDWVSLFLVISLVMISETVNSAIEALCDTVSTEYSINIKYVKDVTAGAVLVSSLISIITGIIIFLPYILNLLNI